MMVVELKFGATVLSLNKIICKSLPYFKKNWF